MLHVKPNERGNLSQVTALSSASCTSDTHMVHDTLLTDKYYKKNQNLDEYTFTFYLCTNDIQHQCATAALEATGYNRSLQGVCKALCRKVRSSSECFTVYAEEKNVFFTAILIITNFTIYSTISFSPSSWQVHEPFQKNFVPRLATLQFVYLTSQASPAVRSACPLHELLLQRHPHQIDIVS